MTKAVTAEASAEAKSHITFSKLPKLFSASKTNQEVPHRRKIIHTQSISYCIYPLNIKLDELNNAAISLNGARKAAHNSFRLCEAPYSSGHTFPLIDR